MLRVAINGYGRIGRNILRALYENNYRQSIQIVAINDLASAELNAHLTQYDSVHGRFSEVVSLNGDKLMVNEDAILLLNEKNPKDLPWSSLGVDVVFECTGLFTSKEKAQTHRESGAKAVLISAPACDADAMVVYGVNDEVLNENTRIISNASCTTNCLAPVAKALDDAFGVEQGAMTTIHAFTNDQNIHDVSHKDIYRARAATQSMIPTKTGAAIAVGYVLPQLEGKLDGMAIRVPSINVSVVDLHCLLSTGTDKDTINQVIKKASETFKGGIMAYNQQPLVSIDFNHNPASSCFDATQTMANGRWVKIMSWYDNEWGFSNRMLDMGLAIKDKVLT